MVSRDVTLHVLVRIFHLAKFFSHYFDPGPVGTFEKTLRNYRKQGDNSDVAYLSTTTRKSRTKNKRKSSLDSVGSSSSSSSVEIFEETEDNNIEAASSSVLKSENQN